MKKITLIFIFSMSLSNFSLAQTTCNCQADLDYIYPLIKKTPSYKDQIKGAKKQAFHSHYLTLKQKAGKESTLYECFQLMIQLLDPIKDNHMYVRGEAPVVGREEIRDVSFMKTFRGNPTYQALPIWEGNIEALEAQLKLKQLTDLEGIYYYRDIMKIGLVKHSSNDEFYGVVLESALPSWQVGEVMMILKPIKDQRYQVTTGRFMNRALLYFQELAGPGYLYTYGWSKITNTVPHYQRVYSEKPFDLFDWNEQVQYLRIKSFSNDRENANQARAFAKQLETQLKAAHLVIDLRGNTGGAQRVSQPFYKILKRYQKEGKIWVLTNYNTVSNAEQFTVKVSGLKGTTLLGLTTNGQLSYGKNRSNTKTLPSGYFIFKYTDMDFSRFLEYEERGVEPDIRLDPDVDWKEQVLEIINK